MKNVTVSMEDSLLRELRVEAAKASKSVSRFVSEMVAANIRKPSSLSATNRKAQMEALERILSGPKWDLLREGRLPTADERNER